MPSLSLSHHLRTAALFCWFDHVLVKVSAVPAKEHPEVPRKRPKPSRYPARSPSFRQIAEDSADPTDRSRTAAPFFLRDCDFLRFFPRQPWLPAPVSAGSHPACHGPSCPVPKPGRELRKPPVAQVETAALGSGDGSGTRSHAGHGFRSPHHPASAGTRPGLPWRGWRLRGLASARAGPCEASMRRRETSALPLAVASDDNQIILDFSPWVRAT